MGNHSSHRIDAAESHIFHGAGGDSHIHAFHRELPWHHAPGGQSASLDARKSVNQLVSEGRMVDAMPKADTHAGHGSKAAASSDRHPAQAGSDRVQQHAEAHAIAGGAAPKVKILFEQDSKGHSKDSREPDFVINSKGKIEVRNDFEKHPNPDGQIVVRVARQHDQMEPTGAEKKALAELVGYLDGRIKETHPDSKGRKLELHDDQGLVEDTVKHKVARPSDWHLSEPTRHQVERVNRFNGGEGTLDHRQIDSYFPRREVPQAKDESAGVVAVKDAIASLFLPDARNPYGTVRERQEGGYQVGRYGFSECLISAWLTELLGDPPDWSKLDQLVAAGKLPKELGKQLHDPKVRAEFGQFLEKIKGGHGAPTAAELERFLPKELQETIASDTIKRFAAGGQKDPGRIVLGFSLGKSPDKLTAEDLSSEGNRQLMGAADRLFGLAQARQMMGRDDKIEWSGGSPMGARIASVAEHTARSMGTVGWCARGVETALGKLGIHFSGNAADTRGFFENDSRFRRVSMSDLQPGDVVVRGASSSHQWGHIFVYLGNGKEASDHVQSVTSGANYGQSVAFRFVGDQQSRNA